MSKMPIAWHEECLKNRTNNIVRLERDMNSAINNFCRSVSERDHLAMQIEFAQKAGKDGFDNEKFMKVKA